MKKQYTTQSKKGDERMGNMAVKYNALNLAVLMEKSSKIISSAEALKEIKPIEWGDDVLRGERKVKVTKEVRE